MLRCGMDSPDYDVVIMGGALAGASMGLLLRRALPEARILIVERSMKSDFKVGESTSEIAGCFLSRILRLGSWLSREQITKNGLRFWFNSPGNHDLDRCAEMGPKLQVRLPAWQLDRSTLDPHVRQLAVEEGCELWRPAKVRSFSTDASAISSVVIARDDGTTVTVRCKWLIDASGKAAVMARQRNTLKILNEHPTSSMWARFRNVGDLDSCQLIDKHPMLAKRVWSQRATGTNHLTGFGWWAWIIPLRGGEVSVGITWDRRLFQPPAEGSIPERLRTVLMEHPIGAYVMEKAEPVNQDARIYHQLAYYSTEVMAPGWAMVGDAAGFMDPLYSHGIDFIGNTVYAVSQIVIDSLKGRDVTSRVADYAHSYQESYHRWFESLYKDKYYYLGDAELMTAATLMDVGFYFFGPVRLIYQDHTTEMAHMPYHGWGGSVVASIMKAYNRRFVKLAQRRRERGIYGRKNLDWNYIIKQSFTPDLKVLRLIYNGFKLWIRCEWSTWRASKRPPMPATVTLMLPPAKACPES